MIVSSFCFMLGWSIDLNQQHLIKFEDWLWNITPPSFVLNFFFFLSSPLLFFFPCSSFIFPSVFPKKKNNFHNLLKVVILWHIVFVVSFHLPCLSLFQLHFHSKCFLNTTHKSNSHTNILFCMLPFFSPPPNSLSISLLFLPLSFFLPLFNHRASPSFENS